MGTPLEQPDPIQVGSALIESQKEHAMNREQITVVVAALTMFAPLALAQKDLARSASERGRALLAEKRYDEAIAAFQAAVDIWNEKGKFDSWSNYELAKALTAAGRKEQALESYRNAVRWDAIEGELHINQAPIQIALDYAILLAECGREHEAKALYYFGLRRFNEQADPGTENYDPQQSSGRAEPFPFLIVFDPDPTMTFSQYTPERLIAAATAIRIPTSMTIHSDMMKQLRQNIPDWIFPAMCLVWSEPVVVGHYEPVIARFNEAASLATTNETRNWVSMYQDVFDTSDMMDPQAKWLDVANRMAAIGATRRKASVVLKQAQEDLKKVHEKIAIERDL